MATALFVSKRLQYAALTLLVIASAHMFGTLSARPQLPPGAVIVPISR